MPFCLSQKREHLPNSSRESVSGNNLGEDHFRLIFQHIGEGAAVCQLQFDEKGTALDFEVIEVNPAFERRTGITREQAIGKRSSPLLGAPDFHYVKIYSEVALTGKPAVFSTFYPLQAKHFEVSVSSPKRNWFITVVSDISARVRQENQLRESESKFRILFESSRDAILILHPEGVWDCNQAALELLGLESKEELLAKTPWGFSPRIQPDGADSMRGIGARLHEAIAGETKLFEWTFQRENGSCFPAEALFTRINFGGKPAVQAVLRDVTQRKASEINLRNLSRAVEQSSAMILITDLHGRIEYANPKFSAVTGYSLQEALGNTPRLLKSGSTPQKLYQEFWSALKAGKEWRGEFLNRKKNGDLYWDLSFISPITNSQGAIVSYLAIKEDITEAKERLASIEESENRFRQLTENLQAVFWMISTDSRSMLYVSPAYEKIWGRTCESLYLNPQSWLEAIHAEDRPRMEALWKSLPAQFDETYRILRPDGEVRWIRDRAFGIANAEGKLYRRAGIAEDITELKSLDERFHRAHRLESIGALTSGIAHDLNNILAPIIMSASLLREQATDETALDLISTIEEAAARGSEVVKEIVSFARGVRSVQSNLAPRDLVDQVGRIIRKTFPKSIELQIDLPEGLWNITGDLTKLHQVLLNLCVNARDAMPEGGLLIIAGANRKVEEPVAATIPGASPGRYLQLSVIDAGSGIPDSVLAKIFDPFFTTKAPGEGTGLGLSIVLDIVKEHRGFVEVSSQIGNGTTFHVCLPASLAKPLPPVQGPTGQLPQGHGRCILLVDDEPAFLTIMGRTLLRNGYHVVTATGGKVALQIFSAAPEKFAAVVTDLIMPEMDGVKLARGLLQVNPQLPIIASSGYPEDRFLQELTLLGIHTFLKKPYQSVELLQALHQAVR